MTQTRRDFLRSTGKLGLVTYPALLALDLLKPAPANDFNLRGNGNGKKIVILGAGLCGMTAAYELKKLGYQCTLLEARERSGGRCWSIRNGSRQQEEGQPEQVANFDKGLYFNAGPSRIPHHHELSMHYCKEWGVALEVYNNINEATYYYAEGKGPLSNKKIRTREIIYDVRGYMAELLVKAIDQGSLDTAVTKEDSEKILSFLRAEGGLNIDNLYKGNDRRGFTLHPGAGDQAGELAPSYSLEDILSSGLMEPDFYNVATYIHELQMTMFQAVGGNDKIAAAVAALLPGMIKTQCVVKKIRNTENGVTIIYDEKGTEKSMDADYCICTIPLPVLSNIDHNFKSAASRAIDFIPYIQTGKIGMQFNRRFWEEDEMIYGGITHTNNELTQIFYPSNDYQSKKGMLIGYYNFNDKAVAMGKLSPAEREAVAIKKGRLIHPQYDQSFEKSFSVSWHNTPYSKGGWALYSKETRQTYYKALQEPDGHTYFAGEHLTYLNAWMAGAFSSARKIVADLHGRETGQRLNYSVDK